jgi:hypothetical protein
MLGPFYSGCRFRARLEMALWLEPLMRSLVANDQIAMKAGRFEPAVQSYPMNNSIECSLPAV